MTRSTRSALGSQCVKDSSSQVWMEMLLNIIMNKLLTWFKCVYNVTLFKNLLLTVNCCWPHRLKLNRLLSVFLFSSSVPISALSRDVTLLLLCSHILEEVMFILSEDLCRHFLSSTFVFMRQISAWWIRVLFSPLLFFKIKAIFEHALLDDFAVTVWFFFFFLNKLFSSLQVVGLRQYVSPCWHKYGIKCWSGNGTHICIIRGWAVRILIFFFGTGKPASENVFKAAIGRIFTYLSF